MSEHELKRKNPNAPVTNVCIYRLKPGTESKFQPLIERHWPTLRKLDLATDKPALIERVVDRKQRVVYVETFTWTTGDGPNICHKTPEMMQIWEPMGALCDDMEFLMAGDD